MKFLNITLLAILFLPIGPVLSHGYSKNCSEECHDYYCPSEHLSDNKEKVKKNVHSKK